MDKKALSVAQQFANSLSEEDLRSLHEISIDLNPRKADKVTKIEWYEQYEKNIDQYKFWSRKIQNKLQIMASEIENYSARDLQKVIAYAIKERQTELGMNKFLVNTVRISLFRTITRYYEDPKLLK